MTTLSKLTECPRIEQNSTRFHKERHKERNWLGPADRNSAEGASKKNPETCYLSSKWRCFLASSHANKVYHACPQSSSTGGGEQLPSTDVERDWRHAKRKASSVHSSSKQRLKNLYAVQHPRDKRLSFAANLGSRFNDVNGALNILSAFQCPRNAIGMMFRRFANSGAPWELAKNG